MGADLANGWVENGEIVCPWHNLHIDPDTGASACRSLPPLRRFSCELEDASTGTETARRAMLRVRTHDPTMIGSTTTVDGGHE